MPKQDFLCIHPCVGKALWFPVEIQSGASGFDYAGSFNGFSAFGKRCLDALLLVLHDQPLQKRNFPDDQNGAQTDRQKNKCVYYIAGNIADGRKCFNVR